MLVRSFKTINAQIFLAFIKRIENNHPDARKITLVIDNVAYFRSNKVKLKFKNSNIGIKYLPSYSSEPKSN
jgi:transposase